MDEYHTSEATVAVLVFQKLQQSVFFFTEPKKSRRWAIMIFDELKVVSYFDFELIMIW